MEDIKKIYENNNALIEGHFLLSSGLHSGAYLQSALVLKNPKLASQIGEQISRKIQDEINDKVDLVVAPAMGGLIIGYEVAKTLNTDFVFTERVNNVMTLRRGFTIQKGTKIVIVEDIITTGKSTNEVIDILKKFGAKILAVSCIIDRSNNFAKFDVPKISLMNLEVKTYSQDDCPMCKENLELVKPGSRKII